MESNNPFYFGQYPGNARYKKPKKKPAEYEAMPDLLDAEEYFEVVLGSKSLLNAWLSFPTKIPRWLVEAYIDDAKKQLVAQRKASDMSDADLSVFTQEELQDLKGVDVKIGYDDFEVMKQKGISEGVNKILQRYGESLFEPNDYANRIAAKAYQVALSPDDTDYRERLNEELVPLESYQDNRDRLPPEKFMLQVAQAAIARRMLNGSTGAGALAGGLNLNTLAQEDYSDPATWSLEKRNYVHAKKQALIRIKQAVTSFETGRSSVVSREKNFDSVVQAVAAYAGNEYRYHFVTDPTDPTASLDIPGIVARLDAAGLTGHLTTPLQKTQLAERVRLFVEKQALIKQVGGYGGYTDYLNKNVERTLSELAITGRLSGSTPADRTKQLDKLKEFRANLGKQQTSLQDRVQALRSSGMSADAIAEFERFSQNYRADLTRLSKFAQPGTTSRLDKLINAVDPATGQANRLKIQSLARPTWTQFSNLKARRFGNGGLGGSDFLQANTQRKMIRNLMSDFEEDRLGFFKKVLQRGEGGLKFDAILEGLSSNRRYEHEGELIKLIEGGPEKLIKTYIWPRVKNKIIAYTPSHYISDALKRVNHFGLIYSDSSSDLTFLKRMSKNWDWDGVSGGALGGLKVWLLSKTVLNGFKVNLPGYDKPFRVWGNSAFKFIGDKGSGILGMDEGRLMSKDAMKAIFGWSPDGINVRVADAALLSDPEIMRLFNIFALHNPQGLNPFVDSTGKVNVRKLRSFVLQYQDYRKWLRNHAALFPGINVDDPEFLFKFSSALLTRAKSPDYAKITQKVLGGLDRLYQGLNITQTFIIRKFGHIIAPLGLAKKALNDTITDLVSRVGSNIVGLLGSGATGPLGTALNRVITRVLYFVIHKTLDLIGQITKPFSKVIFSGDIMGAIDALDVAVDKYTKKLISLLSLPLGCMLLITLFFTTVFTSGTNRGQTYRGGGDTGTGGGVHSGGGYKACSETTILPTDCVFQPGWRITAGVYNSEGETYTNTSTYGGGSGHGSNYYWSEVMKSGYAPNGVCSFMMPVLIGSPSRARAPTNNDFTENNICVNVSETPATPEYGLAIDVFPQTGSCASLYLPGIPGHPNLRWEVSNPTNFGKYGNKIQIKGYKDGDADNVADFNVLVGHSANAYIDSTLPGEKFGELYNWGNNSHAHIEFYEWQGGQWVAVNPNNHICNNTPLNIGAT